MSLIQAETASISWKPEKHRWTVTIAIGEEVIKRSTDRPLPREATDDLLRTCAAETAEDEGYSVLPDEVIVVRA
jgi:hypothetical protein